MPNFKPFNVIARRGEFTYTCRVSARHCEITVTTRAGAKAAIGEMSCTFPWAHVMYSPAIKDIFEEHGRVAAIEEVQVFPGYMRKGVGSEIARLMLQATRCWGAPACYLRDDSELKSVGFWESFGFTTIHQNDEGCTFMRREICPGATLDEDESPFRGSLSPVELAALTIETFSEFPATANSQAVAA